MVEDKYIGLSLAVTSSLAIGASFVITKKVRSHTAIYPPSLRTQSDLRLESTLGHNS
jgi:hypothetical protein